MKKEINILFGATFDFLRYATVTSLSVLKNLPKDYQLHIYYLYADTLKPISEEYKKDIYEKAIYTFDKHNIKYDFYDVSNYVKFFEGQSIGMWGKEVSYSHYLYLLAPVVLKDVEKVIYLDCDMCVNCDLSKVFETNMHEQLIAMGAPRGFEEMGDDVSNSGFSMLNLKQWQKEKTLKTLLDFGKTIYNERFCDQYLLYNYFTKQHKERLLLLDYRYNIFPQMFPALEMKDIYILHYTGYNHIKPWDDLTGKQRGSFLWWDSARETCFYESFINNFYQKEFHELNAKMNNVVSYLENKIKDSHSKNRFLKKFHF